MNELDKLKDKAKGLVIHHWDTDGLCSAALLWRYFPEGKIDLEVPTIGNYFLTPAELERFKAGNYDFIITADINFPPATIADLQKICPEVYVFDHHHQEPIKGIFYYNQKCPGCSFMVSQYLGAKPDLLAVLGMVGDKEEKIKEDKEYYPYVQAVEKKEQIDFEELLVLRRYLDSLYIVEDYDGLEYYVKLLSDDPKEILNDPKLAKNVERIDQEITHYLETDPRDLGDNIYEYQLDSEYNILSHTARGLARKYKDKIIFVFQQKKDIVNVYVRRTDLDVDLEKIVDFARQKKYSAGGKPEVAGIILPLADWKNFHDELVNKIKEV